MGYISFLDLLGIKAIAAYNSQEYFGQINAFQNSIRGIASCDSYLGLKIQAFSDCAYIESENLYVLFKFLNNLRDNLFAEQIFFNAAVMEGTLECTDKKIFFNNKRKVGSCVTFNSPDTTKVYSSQANFTGIGITVNEDIVSNLNIELREMIVQSAYCLYDVSGTYKNFKNFYDLKYINITLDLFSNIVKSYIKTIILDKRAARYYLSAIITCVNTLTWEELINGYIKKFLEIQNSFKRKEFLPEFLPVNLVIINRMFSFYDTLCSTIDISKFNETIIEIINNSALNHNIKNISEYSDCLITNQNKYLLSKFIKL